MKIQRLFIGLLFAFSFPVLALAAQVQVSVGSGYITPSTVTVNAGDTVVWNNVSATTQSVTGDNSLFQSGSIAPGGQFAATFNTVGTYNYYDNAGGNAILGEVIVTGTSVTTPTAVPTQTTYVNPNANYQPVASSANTAQATSLAAEVQSLIAEINALEGGSSGASVNTSLSGSPAYTGGTCPQIGRVLSLGSSGSDVSSLQQFLAANPSIYPQGLITGYYGTLTQAAVQNWQTANNIISYGTPATTGFGVVGPRTAAAIRLACSQGGGGSSSTATGGGIVSGFLQASPVSGSAPLAITVNTTVNSANSCTGATYSLDFGDGSQDQQIPVAAGNCSQATQAFQHTYQYGGSYTITLSSGSHQSTATVTVSGPAAPSATSGTSGQATGSMQALVTSGPAPLSTTFYVSCASGLAYDLVFGDGQDLGSSGVSQSSCSGGLQGVTHTYSTAGTYTAQLVIFVKNSNGTISSQMVANQEITATGTTTSNTPPSGSTTYSPPTLTPNVGGNPLVVSLQFDIGSCVSYTVQWGDTQTSPGTGSCGGSGNTTQTENHTYAQAGSYTVTLLRGSQTDTVGVSISD